MFPDPIYSLGGFVAEIVTAEIATEKQNEIHIFAVRSSELVYLGGFFLATLIRVGKVAG